ncbi:NapC/NirT family cytochrome c [Salipaludibacillus sp. CUR1]|uniref:cytochrome c3 family protein n=1 Tax=Salipaludibacillus sp. CUR1 TaxID=2820003 RepID=UPI001E60A65F|nr:NapC/NirT family cytochrome c [Salipaludibacillus sp. CUR1]
MSAKLKKFRLDKRLLLFTVIGIFLGITFFAGTAGTMKATDSGEFCASCHLMETAYESYSASNHATLSCNDCHAPRDSTTSKMAYKAKAGASHVYMNTIGSNNIPNVIHATAESKDVINANCIDCHETGIKNVAHDGAYDSCIDCHRQVPHGKGDYRPDEWFEPQSFQFAEPNR